MPTEIAFIVIASLAVVDAALLYLNHVAHRRIVALLKVRELQEQLIENEKSVSSLWRGLAMTLYDALDPEEGERFRQTMADTEMRHLLERQAIPPAGKEAAR